MEQSDQIIILSLVAVIVLVIGSILVVTKPQAIGLSDDTSRRFYITTGGSNQTCTSNCGQNNTASCDSYTYGQCDFAQKVGVDLQFKKLLNGTGLNISSNSSNIIYQTSFKNGTGIQIIGSKDQTFTNTGVISGSCSNGITCSGTNPLSISGAGLQNQETTTCTSAGGTTVVKSSSGGNCSFYGLTAGSGLTITQNTNDNQYAMVTQTACTAGAFVSQVSGSSVCSGGVTRNDANTVLSTATPTLVQNKLTTCSTAGGGTTCTLAFTSNLGANNIIIVCEGTSGNANAESTPTDTLGLTYSGSIAGGSTTSVINACYKAKTGSGGADTVTGHYGAGCDSNSAIVCVLSIWEVSGSDYAIVNAQTCTNNGITSFACTTQSFTNTPLVILSATKATAGTDTAGTNFALANGETGSLKYITEKSTSLTSTSTTCPATFGTASNTAGACIVIIKSTNLFSINLSANTNYVLEAHYALITGTATSGDIWIRGFGQSTTTLQLECDNDYQTVANSGCTSTVDTVFPIATSATVSNGFTQYITVKVGANADTLNIDYGAFTGATANIMTMSAGSYIRWEPVV